jgi:hypothetical protein
MHTSFLSRPLVTFAAVGLLALATTATAATIDQVAATTAQPATPPPTPPLDAAGRAGISLPQGWMVLHLPSINGHFRAPDSNDHALLMYREDQQLSGLVAVTLIPGGGQATMVKTFNDDNVHPPVLSLIEPGDYQPVCHAGHACAKVHLAHQAIGLHFGEASSAIIYFDGKQYREMAMTD